MKKRGLIICILISALAVFTLAGCGSARDDELHNKLIGCWVPVEDPNEERDENGNIITFSIYEFTETETKCYIVHPDHSETYDVNTYAIQDGNFRANVNGKVQFAKISFSEEGDLLWGTNSATTVYRPATRLEIVNNGVPILGELPEDNSVEEYVSSKKAEEAAQENQ